MQNPIDDPNPTNLPSTPDPDRHARKCAICHHPQRAEIDEDYLHWRRPSEITRDYGLGHYSTLHRHAKATGLKALRRDNVCAALDSIIENAEFAKTTGSAVVRAVRLSAQLTGQWHEPVKSYLIVHQSPSGELTAAETRRRPGIFSPLTGAPDETTPPPRPSTPPKKS